MKPKVEFTLVHEDGLLDDIILGFTTLEQIDSFIQTFVEMRDDLEGQIEAEKQRRHEKRKRRKERKKRDKFCNELENKIWENIAKDFDEKYANMSAEQLNEELSHNCQKLEKSFKLAYARSSCVSDLENLFINILPTIKMLDKRDIEPIVRKFFEDFKKTNDKTQPLDFKRMCDSNANVSYAKLDEILKGFNKALEDYMEQFKNNNE